jgi:hypothetical protein
VPGGQGADLTLLSPDKAMTVTVARESVPPGYTLERYGDAAEGALRAQYPEVALVSLERVVMAGRPAYKRVALVGASGGRAQLAQFAVLLDGGRMVQLVHCGATPRDYDSLASFCEGIAASLESPPAPAGGSAREGRGAARPEDGTVGGAPGQGGWRAGFAR